MRYLITHLWRRSWHNTPRNKSKKNKTTRCVCVAGKPLWSAIITSAQEIDHFFKETTTKDRYTPSPFPPPYPCVLTRLTGWLISSEGIMVKDLDSSWDPGDRSTKWLKLKPDYMNTGSDLDVIIIGMMSSPQPHDDVIITLRWCHRDVMVVSS